MLSHNYRIKLEEICKKIASSKNVELSDMIWAEKLAKANMTAAKFLRQARRKAINPNMQEGDVDDFLNVLDLGDPDPSNHRTGFDSPEDIARWFGRKEEGDEWRRRD
jgi:hypothetical protein